jgi:hypothetical protein
MIRTSKVTPPNAFPLGPIMMNPTKFSVSSTLFSGCAIIAHEIRQYVGSKEIMMASSTKARVVIAPTGVVNVHVSAEILYNLEAAQQLTKTILGRLGCPGCTSGRQILFHQEEGEFTVGN